MADILRKDKTTIIRWCKSGRLPAIAEGYGSTIAYRISRAAIDLYIQQRQKPRSKARQAVKEHKGFLADWKDAMEKGLMTGRVFSPLTVEDYLYYVSDFLDRYNHLTIENLQMEFLRLSSEQYCRKYKLYKASVCFAKFLISKGELTDKLLSDVKPLSPKRHKPPKRQAINVKDLESLLAACTTDEERLMVTLLSETGLRASEACSIMVNDIDLETRMLTVRKGKGGKDRRIGLTLKAMEAIQVVLPARRTGHLLVNSQGRQEARYGLQKRLHKLASKAGVKCSPHALRRAFVTHNANKGRPLQMLQMACGHSDIKTTMTYVRTTEQEMIEEMKGW